MSLGVVGDRIHTISYGEEMPVDKEQTEEGWAKNRRAHIAVVNK
jgi:outer membrane protein OmpA-like peptidoglycan-associated protein